MNKRLEKLLSKSKEMADELKEKQQAKAKVDEEIEKIQMKELKAFLIANDMILNSDFFDLMALVKGLIDNGIGMNELKELAGTESQTKNIADKKKPDTIVTAGNKPMEEKESDEK